MGANTISATKDHITEIALAESSTRIIPKDSVAIVTRSGILERALPVGHLTFNTTLNQDIKAIHPNKTVSSKWIAWFLRSQEQNILRTCRKAGTTVASISLDSLKKYPIPLPPLSEQNQILASLEKHISHLQAAQSILEKSITRTTTLKGSLHDTITGASKASTELPLGWSWGTLGDVIENIEAGKSFHCEPRPADKNEWGVIKVSAMTRGEFNENEQKAVPKEKSFNRAHEIRPGDILLSRANTSDYVGASVLVKECRPRLLLSDKSLRLTPKKGVDKTWLIHALSSPHIRRQISAKATGTKESMRNISQRELSAINIPIPPLEAQVTVGKKLEDLTHHTVRLSDKINSLQQRAHKLHQALLDKAFPAHPAKNSLATSPPIPSPVQRIHPLSPKIPITPTFEDAVQQELPL